MNRVLLVSESEIKNQSVLEQNIDSKVLSKIIANVQEIQLRPILGDTLYESVLNDVYELSVNNTALPQATVLLLEPYIVPYLTYATLTEFLVINNYKVGNKGVLRLNDNAGSSLAQPEVEYVKNYFDQYTSMYKRRLIDYLGDNSLITSDDSPIDADTTSSAIGWYLEKPYGECLNSSIRWE